MPDKILVVDDEAEIADLVELYLTNENFLVHKFYSANDALECIKNEQLDLAILDVMLPDISGLQICQKIRENYSYPVLMLTIISPSPFCRWNFWHASKPSCAATNAIIKPGRPTMTSSLFPVWFLITKRMNVRLMKSQWH